MTGGTVLLRLHRCAFAWSGTAVANAVMRCRPCDGGGGFGWRRGASLSRMAAMMSARCAAQDRSAARNSASRSGSRKPSGSKSVSSTMLTWSPAHAGTYRTERATW